MKTFNQNYFLLLSFLLILLSLNHISGESLKVSNTNINVDSNYKSKDLITLSDHRYEILDSLVSKYGDRLSVSVIPLDDSDTYKKNSDVKFVSASMIKLLILCKFMEDVDNGKIDLLDFYSLNSEDVVGGSGILQNLPIGTLIPYDELALYMIIYSDNTATNILIDLLGMDAINQKAKDLGLKNTELNRKMMDWTGVENYISSDDIEIIYKGIINKTIASQKMCEKALDYLLKNTDLTGVAKGIPKGIRYAHKTGTLTGINHDGGIVYAKNGYIINVLTRDFADMEEALSLIGTISQVTYKILNE